MLNLAKMFGKSPFSQFIKHMDKVALCVEKWQLVLLKLHQIDATELDKLCSEVSELEHDADIVKNYMRNHLPTTTFLPFDRWQFLDMLAIQDDIADKAEEIVDLCRLKTPLDPIPEVEEALIAYVRKNYSNFLQTKEIVHQLDNLVEVGFGGPEAAKVATMIDAVHYADYESGVMRGTLLKEFCRIGDRLPHSSFWIWCQVISEVGQISHTCERLVNRIRMMLDIHG